jgi:hypothetical protein
MLRGKDRRLLSASPREPTSASSASHNLAFDRASISNGMPIRTETFAAYINRSGSTHRSVKDQVLKFVTAETLFGVEIGTTAGPPKDLLATLTLARAVRGS